MRNPSLLLGLSDPGKNHEENPAFDRSSIVVEEIKKLVVEKPSVEWSELRPGSFYLITGARSSDSAFLFQLDRTEVASLFGAPDYRVTARPSEHISNLSAVEIGSFAEKIHVVHADLRPMVLGTDNVSKYTFTEFTEEEFHKFGEKLIPHINFAPEARYRRTEFQSSEQDYLSFISLHGLQYTRWAMYEETPDKISDPVEKAAREEEIKKLEIDYVAAVNKLIGIVGEESFARQVLKIAKDQEDWKHLTSKEFKPHSDTTPLGRYRMTIARGFLGADYSLINEDMGVHKGHTRVNELPLFGDVLFLQTLKDNFPSIFAKVVSEWQSDPKISTLISQYFPAAKQLIS